MESPAENAAKFVSELAALVNRLATRGIVVSALHTDWGGFGCWELLVQSGKETAQLHEELRRSNPTRAHGAEVVKCFWDGRDKFLTIEASPTRIHSAPNEWKRENVKGFEKAGIELLQFVEDYLTKRFPNEK